MNLKKISIENFKCYKSQTDIEFGKLTLLTGANSSGKSSIIYSILGAIQSEEFPFQFSTNGKYVNMGDFNSIVHDHNTKGRVKIKFEIEDDLSTLYDIKTIWVNDRINNLPKLSSCEVNTEYFSLSAKFVNKKFSIDLSYDTEKDPVNKNISKITNQKFDELLFEIIESVSKEGTTDKKMKYLNELNTSKNIKNFTSDSLPILKSSLEIEGSFRLKKVFTKIISLFTRYESQINFISSFRLHPERTYLEQTKAKLKVNNFGDGYLDQIILWETKNRSKYNELLKICKRLELIESIKSNRLGGGRFEMLVKVKTDGVDISLSDVGFGISQFLPIIVADLQLPDYSTLFIAQPEIHLHPSIQSSFGDYLVNQIHTKNKRYVIETHSEYLLNKIRLAIVKGEIEPEDVKVLFVDTVEDETIVHKVKFNKSGQIIDAPNNFFKTYMMDVMDIAINAVQ